MTDVPGRQPDGRSDAPLRATANAPSDVPGVVSARMLAGIGLIATALHALFDAVTASIPVLAPPYLRLGDAPEEFHMLSPLAVSIAVSCVSGLIAVISVAAVLPAHRRGRVLGAMIAGFWLFSAVLLRIVWLSTPWGTLLLSLVPGLVRGAVIGWVIAAITARGVSARTGEGA